jgi:prepilin peptidase CpaA
MKPASFQDYLVILTAATVVSAALYDYRRRLIPNFITFPAIFTGLLIHWLHAGASGFYFSLRGLAIGGGFFLVLYLIGGIGGGDVKLLGSVGAFVGGEKILVIIILTVLIGGVMAIGKLGFSSIRLNRLGYFVGLFQKNQAGIYGNKIDPLKDTIPYGVAIAAGTLAALALY